MNLNKLTKSKKFFDGIKIKDDKSFPIYPEQLIFEVVNSQSLVDLHINNTGTFDYVTWISSVRTLKNQLKAKVNGDVDYKVKSQGDLVVEFYDLVNNDIIATITFKIRVMPTVKIAGMLQSNIANRM